MNGSEMLSIWTTPINEKGEGTTQRIMIHTLTLTHTYTYTHTHSHSHSHTHSLSLTHTHTRRRDCNGKFFFLGGYEIILESESDDTHINSLGFLGGGGNFRAAFFSFFFHFYLYFL